LLKMSDVHAALIELLSRHVSPIIARSILTRALREHGVEAADLTRADVQVLASRLESAARLFVDPGELDAFKKALDNLGGEQVARHAVTISVLDERDLAEALAATRRLCQLWRVRLITQQKIATVVSELARNIVSYTPGGLIELIPLEGSPQRLVVRASDSGGGISNLEEIMAGRYKSRTGLGKGLLGSKRLVDRFEVRSGPGGTVIEAELDL
jgi:serine/threonine-protein kinase RsbT